MYHIILAFIIIISVSYNVNGARIAAGSLGTINDDDEDSLDGVDEDMFTGTDELSSVCSSDYVPIAQCILLIINRMI